MTTKPPGPQREALAIFDDRSANAPRTSGWERYSRSLLGALGARVDPLGLKATTLRHRLITDWATLPSLQFSTAKDRWPVHLPTFPPTPFLRGPLVWTVHDLTWWFHRETSSAAGRAYYGPLAALAMKRKDIVWVTPSHQVRTDILNHFDLEPDSVISTPLGVSRLPETEAFPSKRPYILSVATLEPRKNLPFLLRAYSRSRISKTHDLRLIGRRGWRVATPSNVVVMGAVDDHTLASLYRGAAALVAPSLYEGFGLPLIESMSVGLRVMCSNIPIHREVAGELGNYFSLTDVGELVDLLDDLDNHRDRDSERRKQWARRYTWENCASLTVTAYERAKNL